MARAPLAKGDDGSGNRYPARQALTLEEEHRNGWHRPANADCPRCVPAALIVPTPEPVDYTLPACER